MSGSAPKADPNVGWAAAQTVELSRQAFEWQKNEYQNTLRPLLTQFGNVTLDAAKQGIDLSNKAEARAAETYAFERENLRPVVRSMAKDALAYDSVAKRTELARDAGANIQTAYQAGEQQLNREMARRGVTPSSGQQLALASQTNLARSAAMGGAMNQARTQAEETGFARKAAVAGVQNAIAGQSATQSGLATSAAATATGASGQGAGIAQGSFAAGSQPMQTQISGMQQAGALWSNASSQNMAGQQQADQNKQAVYGAIAGIAVAF